MKILYATNEFQNNMALWQKYHFIDELKGHGVQFELVLLNKYDKPDDFNRDIIKRIKDCDLFLTAFSEKNVYVKTVERIKEEGIPTVLICFDNLVMPYFHKHVAKHYDLVWLTSKETEPLFKKWGAKTVFLPYAANPNLYSGGNHEKNRVVFIGTPYGSRKRMLAPLINNDVRIDLFYLPPAKQGYQEEKSHLGQTIKQNKSGFFSKIKILSYHFLNKMGFKIGRKLILSSLLRRFSKVDFDINRKNVNVFPAVDISSLFETYSQYGLSISSSSAVNTGYLKTPVPIINLRNFEIPMAGLAQICRYNEELSNYFEEGKEIIFYRNDKELVEKCRYFLDEKNRKELLEIGSNARKRSVQEHTWFCRFKRIF